jgi:peptide alpha-N-acetyltransferase
LICACSEQAHRALALVAESMTHTPSVPDTYMLRARILKHAGDAHAAHASMDQARRLDTQDRYLNVKCTRYALRADNLKAAEETVALFLRDGDGLQALNDLQVVWYETCAADLHVRARDFGRALKMLHRIDKHFTVIYEDQFDFHQYNLRKGTLRAYVSMVRWLDDARAHRYHVRAACAAVRVYLRLFDDARTEAIEASTRSADEQQLSEEERRSEARRAKKAAAKARAAEEKAAAEAAERAAAASKAAGIKGRAPPPVDPDPEGTQLVRIPPADLLAQASRFVAHLTSADRRALQSHTLAVEVHARKERFLIALRHLLKALTIDTAHPDTHVALCTFLTAVRAPEAADKLHPLVKEAVEREW